ncbi:MAG: hypothetical protein F9K16_08630 [Thermoanaerobaculia bacterium]|nr:MAG: hypothetical protein F9K16_08630 [Thermoanaerobaculia bacterium]MBZ0102444.1 hypothetical protein [Thermoanaerobaculia bacterium]
MVPRSEFQERPGGRKRRSFRRALASLAALFGLARGGVAQLVPVDPVEFQVNSCTELAQHEPALTPAPDGSFVVVWSNDYQGNNNDPCKGIRGRRLGPGESPPVDPEIQISEGTLPGGRRPRVAADAEGNFVVVWDSRSSFGSDTSAESVQARRYRADGTPLDGAEFQVNVLTDWSQHRPDVAVSADGDFVVVWESYESAGSDPSGTSIQARRYRADGTPLDTVELQINTRTGGNQRRPRVASLPHGGFVVTWQTYDDDYWGVAARRFGGDGEALDAEEIAVNVWTSGDQLSPSIAAAGDGTFVVVWESGGSFGDDDDLTSIQMRRFDREGQPLQLVETQVNTLTLQWQEIPTVAADPAGNFVVGWLHNYVEGPGYPPVERLVGKLRRYSVDGVAVDPVEFEANALESGWVVDQRLTSEGVLGLVWSGGPTTGNDPFSSIQARRFTRPPILVGGGQGPQGAGCSLVDAIAAANTGVPQGECPPGSGGAVITLPEGGRISLASVVEGQSATPVVRTPITIRGHGATVERDAALGCAGPDPFRLFEIDDGGYLSMQDVKLRNGCVPGAVGGAVLATGGALRLDRVRISDSRAADGAGVALTGAASLIAVDTTLERNVASGLGGGVAALDPRTWIALDRATLAHNSAATGGGVGLASGAALDLFQGTLSANAATSQGGGIGIEGEAGEVSLTFSTITGGSAPVGSSLAWGSGAVLIHDSLVGDGAGGDTCASTGGTLAASGWNLATDPSCGALAGGAVGEVGKLGLGPLRHHGGIVATHLPLAGSPALDTAPSCAGPNGRLVSNDARRYPRPTDDDGDGDARCDLGAVERGPLFVDGFESGDLALWGTFDP